MTQTLCCLLLLSAAPAGPGRSKDWNMLKDFLDLDRPGLEKVKAAAGNAGQAAAELLAYYRARKSVKHPVDRSRRAGARGEPLRGRAKAVADDALKNVLVTCPHYPRFDFGKDIDWLTNRAPNGDSEWLWQLNRHASWSALGRAYWRTGEEKYAQCYVRQLLGWISQCPRQRKSPAWRTIEAGLRGHGWTGHFQHFLDSPAYTPEVLVKHLGSFHDHALHLHEVLESRGKSNWGLMEAEGLAFIAITFPEFRDAAQWRKRAFGYLVKAMNRQVRPDGHHWEQCIGYHLGGISWLSRTAELAETNGLGKEFPPKFWKRLESMCEVPLKLGLPDGRNAQFGDDHSQFHWRRRVLKWARFFSRDDLIYAATAGKEGKPAAQTAFALTDSGFYSMRSGWDRKATMLVLKCGPGAGFHSQPDNCTFEIFAGGRRLTPDSGSYIYGGDAAGRKWFRQTRVHQTLTLDGKDTAYAPKLLLWKPGESLDILVVENRSYGNLTHRRAVLFVKKKYFVIVDEALGAAQGKAMLHFQLAPGEAVFDEKTFSARTSLAEGANLLVRGMAQKGLGLAKEAGQVSFEYGKKGPRPAFRFQLQKGGESIRFVTVLVPYEGEPPRVTVGVTGSPPPGASRLELAITVNGEESRPGYDLAEGPRGAGPGP